MPDDDRLRVLQVVPQTTGGIGAHVQMLCAELTRRGHELTVAAPTATLDRLAVDRLGVRTTAIDAGSLRSAFGARAELRRLAADHDVVHAHGVRAGANVALSVSDRPVVATWHNAPIGGLLRRSVHAALERVCARRAAAVLGASADLVERARRAGADDARLCELPAPIRAVAPAAADQPLQHPPTVLAIARLHPQKRLDLLIEVAGAWRDRPAPPRVVIAGDGPLAAELRRQAESAGAPVEFLGARDDVPALLAGADVVVLPSDWEARPFVAQEALRAGVPLVATDVGGVRDLVGDAALLVPPGDADALRDAIERVLGDDALRARLRTAGPARAAEWPTPGEMAASVERLYRDVIMRPAGRAG